MKVLFLCDFGSAHGGAEIATLSLRDGLRERGHEALLLSSTAKPSDLPILADVVCRGSVGRSQVYLQTANVSAWKTVRRTIEKFKPDVVHISMFLLELSPLVLPLLREIPTVYHAHWMRAVCPTGTKLLPDRSICQNPPGKVCYRSGCVSLHDWPLHMAQLELVRRWKGGIDQVVTPSAALGAALTAAEFTNVITIPNGVPVIPARPPLMGPPVAFFCGRLVKEKGIDVLLKAWKAVVEQIPEAQLHIAGEGPERSLLERIAPLNVTFLGHVSHGAMEGAAGSAWVQVVPSVWFENFPLVVLESLMRGTAVIASRIGGIPEIVPHGQIGKLVPPNDAGELADELIAMLEHREQCEDMGRQARSWALERFDRQVYLDRFEELYRGLIENRAIQRSG